ncbi:MAG: hypothetical protein Q8L34_01440 [Candidatus Woesearchaeota archaeon]|nr:hypothetical protein [Candidatus Woesearchaeota archaeon]
MKTKQIIAISMVLLVIGLFVQATTEDTSFATNQSDQDETLAPAEKEVLTDDLPMTQQNLDLTKEQSLEAEDVTTLQPSLPGPKPEEMGIDNPTGLEQGENWERTCTETNCEHTLYSYQKYYQDNGLWRSIDENFYSTPCQNGYDFCVVDNLYQMQMKSYANESNTMRFTVNDVSFTFTPSSVDFQGLGQRQNIASVQRSPAQVTNNRVLYSTPFTSNFDLSLRYLPRMFKEDLIIHTKEGLPAATLSQNNRDITFDVSFIVDVDVATQIIVDNQVWDKQTTTITNQPIEIRQGNTSFYLAQPIAYDKHGVAIPLTYVLENRQNTLYLTLQTSYEWLMHSNRVYPVTIDPTFSLEAGITWDGYLTFDNTGDVTGPTRNGVSTSLVVGDFDKTDDPGFVTYRTDIDWDISSVPDTAGIIDLNFTFNVELLNASNNELRFYHMVGGNANYSDDDAGNLNFFDDIGDGTNYLNATLTANSNMVNLSSSSLLMNDLSLLLQTGTNEWNLGMRSKETQAIGNGETYLSSNEGAAANRSKLTIIYASLANETEGEVAIIQGIINALGTVVLIHDEQQIQTRTTANVQQLGRFDEFAISTNSSKRWGINYVTSGESFTNMNNLSNVVYILELANLTPSQITAQVETFIRGTL